MPAMEGELYDSTIPFGEPELLKTSAYRRYLEELGAGGAVSAGSRWTALSPSLQIDLWDCEQNGDATDVLQTLAACLRHSSRVAVQLQCAERVVPLTVFPHEGLVHSPMVLEQLLIRHLPRMRVLNVEPAVLRPPGDPVAGLVGEARLYRPLAPLLWLLALYGPRVELLPEIAGPAVYRVSPAFDASRLDCGEGLGRAIGRLREAAIPLAALAGWPGFDRGRASRLLNAIYLQSGLIISRSHPDALREVLIGDRA